MRATLRRSRALVSFTRSCSSSPSEVLRLIAELQSCRDVAHCRRIQDEIIRNSLDRNERLVERLSQMYLDVQCLPEAWDTFTRLQNPPASLCTNMVDAFAAQGSNRAFHLFRRMQLQGVPASSFLVVPLLKLCTNESFLPEGKLLHACIAERRLDREIFVGNTLVTMYRKCGTLEEAEEYFWSMPERNQMSWNAIIAAFAEDGDLETTLMYFHWMQLEGVLPNRVTFLAVLNVFTGKETLKQARKIHELVLVTGYTTETSITNAILNAYSKNGGLSFAREAFDRTVHRDIITWTTLVDAYSESGESCQAFGLFRLMLRDGVMPNKITLLSLIKGCSFLPDARFLQSVIAESGYQSNSVLATNLIKMYSRCGSPEDARQAFDAVVFRDAILWTSLITACSEHRRYKEAIRFFLQMQTEGFMPDVVTYTAVLDACAEAAAIAEGKHVHASIVKSRIKLDVALENAILNMYGKCGKLADARDLFARMQQPDLLSWSIYVSSHALHGYGKEALELFQEMFLDGVETDYCVFVNLISACRHSGLVDEGCEIFHRMVTDCNISANSKQFGCIVDLLARAGQVDIAEEVLRAMPVQPSQVTWKAYLSACKEQGDITRAKWAAEKAMEMVPQDTSAYVVLANALKDV